MGKSYALVARMLLAVATACAPSTTITEALVWSAQSKTTNPSSLESFSRTFVQAVEYQLIKDGIITK